MTFLLDENFPKSAVSMLNELGHEVLDVRGTSREGMNDTDLFEFAQANEAIFLTTDRDFYHTVPHQFSSHFGVVVVALRQPNRANIMEKVAWLLEQDALFPLTNCVLQLRDTTVTIRRPPESDE